VRAHTSVKRFALKKSNAVVSRWDALVQLYGQLAPRLENILNIRHSIGLTDFLALRSLARHFEPHMRIQQLAAELGISHSAASRLVGKLEKVHILARYECSADRRGTYTELTDAGRAVLKEAESTYKAAVTEMMSSVAATELLRRASGQSVPIE
jgi:DNA-binding MarR family transcriptional regulator